MAGGVLYLQHVRLTSIQPDLFRAVPVQILEQKLLLKGLVPSDLDITTNAANEQEQSEASCQPHSLL